jgi:hypothetical protein
MSNTYEYEYTDTFAGEANYCWVRRGKVTMPCLTHYGYDGSSSYSKANKIAARELMKAVKAELGLTGIRGCVHHYGDMTEFRPYRMNTVLFITWSESDI